MNEKNDNIVEVLENGDVKFDGRLVSSTEFIVGTALCNLRNASNDSLEKEECISDISGDTDSVHSTPTPPVQKKKKVTFSPISLPPDDVRLSYVKDYVAAINSSDADAVLEMLKGIAIPKAVSVKKKLTPDPNFFLPLHIEIVGIEAIAATFGQYFLATPDLVLKLLSERIHVYANGESCIECDLLCCGTKVFEIKGLPEGSSDKVVVRSAVDELGDNVSNMTLQGSKVVSKIEREDGRTPGPNMAVSVGVTKQRVSFSIETKFSMHLNVNKKVFLIITTTD